MNEKSEVEEENFVETGGSETQVKNLKRKIIKKSFVLLTVLLIFCVSLFTRNITNFSYSFGKNSTNSTIN